MALRASEPFALPEHLANDEEAKRLIAQFNSLLESNPLLRYRPHPKQAQFHSAFDPIKAFFGGNRSGKTTAGIVDDLIQSVDRDCLPKHLHRYKKWEPPFFCRIVTPDFTSTMEGVIYQKIREWVPVEQLEGGSWAKAYDKQRRLLRFRNGSWWDFLTYEQDLDKFGGAALHRVHYDEEPPGDKGKALRQECLMRLIDFGGDEVLTMTPLLGLSWSHDEIWEKRHEPGITVIRADMDDNPHLNQETKVRILGGLTKEEKKARKEGRFVHFGGLFFDEFRDEIHVRDLIEPEAIEGQEVVVGIDPGLRRTGITWTAFDNDNAALVFDEFYPGEMVVPEIAAEIKRRNIQWNCEDATYVIDPSARNRNAVNADQIEAAYAREGIYAQHGQNDRGAGILEIKRRLQQGTLVITRECQTLIWEIGRYRRDPNSNDEFAAIKMDDHLIDSLRYAVMSRAWNFGQPERRRRPNFQPNFQPPYSEEPTYQSNPPLGVYS